MDSSRSRNLIPSLHESPTISATRTLISTARTWLLPLTISEGGIAWQLRAMIESLLQEFPWSIVIKDWTGREYAIGGNAPHWSEISALQIHIKTAAAGRDLLALDSMKFLERFLIEEVDIDGNLYLLPEIRDYAKFVMKPWQLVWNYAQNFVLQDKTRAALSVKSHYDIPEESLFYLDRAYRSYSCALWEEPYCMNKHDVLTIGTGKDDTYDSLERAQYTKFMHAANFLAPEKNETVLDVG